MEMGTIKGGRATWEVLYRKDSVLVAFGFVFCWKGWQRAEAPANGLKSLVKKIIHTLLCTGQSSGSPSRVRGPLRVPETPSGVSRSKLFYNATCDWLPFSQECTAELPKGSTLCGSESGWTHTRTCASGCVLFSQHERDEQKLWSNATLLSDFSLEKYSYSSWIARRWC